MTPRRRGAMGTRERRTQEARIAALFARPRTCYRAAQCALAAGALFFSGLLDSEPAAATLVTNPSVAGCCSHRRRPREYARPEPYGGRIHEYCAEGESHPAR